MILKKNNRKSEISIEKIKNLDDKDIKMIAIMITKIRKLKAKKDNIVIYKFYYISGFICFIIIILFTLIELKGSTSKYFK